MDIVMYEKSERVVKWVEDDNKFWSYRFQEGEGLLCLTMPFLDNRSQNVDWVFLMKRRHHNKSIYLFIYFLAVFYVLSISRDIHPVIQGEVFMHLGHTVICVCHSPHPSLSRPSPLCVIQCRLYTPRHWEYIFSLFKQKYLYKRNDLSNKWYNFSYLHLPINHCLFGWLGFFRSWSLVATISSFRQRRIRVSDRDRITHCGLFFSQNVCPNICTFNFLSRHYSWMRCCPTWSPSTAPAKCASLRTTASLWTQVWPATDSILWKMSVKVFAKCQEYQISQE